MTGQRGSDFVPGKPELRVRVTAIGLMALLCGLAQPVTLNFVGEVYASELLLPLAAILTLFVRGGDAAFRERTFWLLLLAAAATLTGYVLSDLVRDSRPDQYMRGWGRILLLASDFVALCMLLRQDRRNLWWFALGIGIGGILHLRLFLHTPISIWKFGYAQPMLLVAAAMGYFLPIRLAALWLAFLGAASMWFDFRSFAAICFLLSAYAWIRARRPWQPLAGQGIPFRLIFAGLAAALLVAGTLSLTDSEYSSQRRAQSDAGRTAAFETGLVAIAGSPLVGYGSWTEDRDLAVMYLKKYQEKRGVHDPNAESGRFFSPHSQVLQSWVEGGLLGATFFLALGFGLLRSSKALLLERPYDMLTVLLVYLYASSFWNLLMSPFSAPHRIQIAMGASALVLLAAERRLAPDRGKPIATQAGPSRAYYKSGEWTRGTASLPRKSP